MRPIKCDEIQSSITDCIERELPTDDLLAHLDTCDRCRADYSDYHIILKKLQQNVSVEEPDESFWQAFPEKVLAQVNDVKNALASESSHISDIDNYGADNYGADANIAETTNNTHNRKVVASNVVPFNKPAVGGETSSRSSEEKLSDQKNTTQLKVTSPYKPFFAKVILSVAATMLMAVGIINYLANETTSPNDRFSHDVLAFQTQINQTNSIPALARQIPTNDSAQAWYSFSAQPVRATPFFVGAYFAESMALLQDSDKRASSYHMMRLGKEFKKGKFSDELILAAEQAADRLANINVNENDRVQALLEFESKYRQYLAKLGEDRLVFYQLGLWTVNMSLAALAENSIVKLEQQNLEYFSTQLLRLSAPLGVITALEDMDKLLSKPKISKREFNKIFDLSMKLRTQLG